MKTLSKSDFQLASSCAKKLGYKKAFYPTNNDTNEYMEMLAQGGYIIGQMAKLYYPGGIEISGGQEQCFESTRKLMSQEDVVLFEPAIRSGQKIVRIDILVKERNKLHLIEVKSASYDSSDPKCKPKLAKHINDAAYQFMVLSEAYPDFEITCSLFMPDKFRRTAIEGLAGWFNIEKGKTINEENEDIITQQKSKFQKPNVVFKYENHPDKLKHVSQLVSNGILSLLDITEEVIALQFEINQKANVYLRILNEGITKADYQIGKNCKGCEFKSAEADKNGYNDCWHDLPSQEHHIFDLYYGGAIKNEEKEFVINELISSGKTSLFDFNPDQLKNKNGEAGARAQRQIIQIENTRQNSEWISPELKNKFDEFQYPLHFIDFETYTGAVPFHNGMRPYELIAFQWSCHTIKYKGARTEHKEWIHTGTMFPDSDAFPNFEFAKSLMQHIGDTGTPLMWATHENTVLRSILNQMDVFEINDGSLKDWLVRMTSDDGREGRWVDMNKLTLQNYFHPYMKGRTSIKKVLPAVWSHFPELHTVPDFKDYAPESFIEGIIDPYDTLTKGINFEEMDDDVVSGGTDAMRAYHRIRFDETLSIEQKDEIRRQLLQYCKLDTMAMVIIAYHWGLK